MRVCNVRDWICLTYKKRLSGSKELSIDTRKYQGFEMAFEEDLRKIREKLYTCQEIGFTNALYSSFTTLAVGTGVVGQAVGIPRDEILPEIRIAAGQQVFRTQHRRTVVARIVAAGLLASRSRHYARQSKLEVSARVVRQTGFRTALRIVHDGLNWTVKTTNNC